MTITRVGYLALFGVLIQPAVASAQPDDEPVIEKLKHGEVDWTEKSVTATGSGSPDLKLENVAVIRLNAERAAKLDAYRKIINTLQGIQVSGTLSGRQALSQGQVRTQVEGIVRGCKIADTRYYRDGGVNVVLRCPLDGGLATSLAPISARKAARVAGAESAFSGLIVDATGLGVRPALQPKIMDPKGTELYSAAMVAPNALRLHGAASYVRTVEAAKQRPRVGKKPLIVKAARLGKSRSDLVIGADLAETLRGDAIAFLAEAKVVVVTGE